MEANFKKKVQTRITQPGTRDFRKPNRVYKSLLTCDDVEALLSARETDVVGDEGGVCIRLHAGVARLPQLQPSGLVGRQEAGPDIWHWRQDGCHRQAHHGVQLGRGIAQHLQGVHVA